MNRLLGSALICFSAAAITFGQEADYSFPQNVQYPHGFMSTNISSSKMQSWFDDWKDKYPQPCGDAIMPTADTETEAKVEGVGWAMITAAYMGDKELFDGIYQFYKSKCTSRAGGMMDWLVNCDGAIEQGSATDGDLDVGFSLIVAYWQWGEEYLQEARDVIGRCELLIKDCDGVSVLAGGYNGGAWGGCGETDISYYTPAFFREFAVVTGNSAWTKLADDTYTLLERAAHDSTGLVPDWQDADGNPIERSATADTPDTLYRYDACRTPWRIALDYLWNGNEEAKEWCTKITDWANGVGADNIVDEYELDGTPTGSSRNMAFTGGLAVGSMCNSQEVVNNFGEVVDNMNASHWYSQHLGNVYLLALTGNMWHKDIIDGASESNPLIISTVGEGTVIRDPDAVRYEPGTPVTLTAEASSGWAFESWSGDFSSEENPITVNTDSAITLDANFVVDHDPDDPDANFLENGDFSSSELDPWVLNAWNDATATGSVTDGEFTVSISTLGEETYDIQLVQRNVPLENDKDYRLTFDASAASDREMDIIIQMPDDPWTSYASETVELTSTTQSYTVDFTMEEETDLDSRLGFNFGNSTEDVTVSNVRLTFQATTTIAGTPRVKAAGSGLSVTSQADAAVKVQFEARKSGETVLRIYDLKGNVVESAKVQTVSGRSYAHTFSSGKLSNGFYILEANNSGHIEQSRIMLTK
ncbi:MAG: glycosyl hydrolase family 8 [Chitinispirillaceae bacterium]